MFAICVASVKATPFASLEFEKITPFVVLKVPSITFRYRVCSLSPGMNLNTIPTAETSPF